MANKKKLIVLLAGVLVTAPAVAESSVALYQGRTVDIAETLQDPTDLWVAPATLESINDFVLKPEGACWEELCVPVDQAEDNDLFVTREERGWFNVSELARRLQQSVVHDADHSVWSFGEIPATRQSYLQSAVAPDFELTDRQGNSVRLSDLRGKKVVIVTWASW